MTELATQKALPNEIQEIKYYMKQNTASQKSFFHFLRVRKIVIKLPFFFSPLPILFFLLFIIFSPPENSLLKTTHIMFLSKAVADRWRCSASNEFPPSSLQVRVFSSSGSSGRAKEDRGT